MVEGSSHTLDARGVGGFSISDSLLRDTEILFILELFMRFFLSLKCRRFRDPAPTFDREEKNHINVKELSGA